MRGGSAPPPPARGDGSSTSMPAVGRRR
jgi:hypothetical protein